MWVHLTGNDYMRIIHFVGFLKEKKKQEKKQGGIVYSDGHIWIIEYGGEADE